MLSNCQSYLSNTADRSSHLTGKGLDCMTQKHVALRHKLRISASIEGRQTYSLKAVFVSKRLHNKVTRYAFRSSIHERTILKVLLDSLTELISQSLYNSIENFT